MIRTLLVDDEPLSVRGLWSVLETDDQVEIVGACDSGTDAVQAIERLLPDLVFLDIEMPGINGIEIARQISSRGSPLVVFVTAFEQHAIDAFTLQALDYVLKPFSDERLLASLTRAKVALEGGGPDKLGYSAARFGPKRAPQGGYLQRVLIHEAQRVRVVTTAEIEWISGAKNYIEVHTARGSFLCRQTMASMVKSLDPRQFVRIHRSVIVALDCVVIVEKGDRRGRVAILRDGARLQVARGHVERLMSALSRLQCALR